MLILSQLTPFLQPRYWCKHCSTYVKDTKFERTQHEATGKHQGNLKRFLRGIQSDHERNERKKDQARAEVDRLNRAVQGSDHATISTVAQPAVRRVPAESKSTTMADRKRQMAQLAELGVSLPDECRVEMALPGDWQVVSQTTIQAKEEAENSMPSNVGIHKRKAQGREEKEEEEEEDEELLGGRTRSFGKRRAWGSTIKAYPSDSTADLDTLLSSTVRVQGEGQPKSIQVDNDAVKPGEVTHVKEEESWEQSPMIDKVARKADGIDQDLPSSAEQTRFKKRRPKSVRNK